LEAKFRRYEVPTEDGTFFAEPALENITQVVKQNHEYLENLSFTIGGIPFREFRQKHQREVLEEARGFTKKIGGRTAEGKSGLVIESGHQGQFVHPGIWLKNFVCHHIAQKMDACGVNMIVDNDEVKECEVTLPVVQEGRALRRTHPYAREPEGVAFEECRAEAELIERCREDVLKGLPAELMSAPFEKLFSFMREKVRESESLVFCLAGARRALEEEFGIYNLEVPLSAISNSQFFIHFFLEVVRRAEEYACIYNETLDEYRSQYGIKTENHPLPNLEMRGDWVELPFWGWHPGGRRSTLSVKREARGYKVMLDSEAVLQFSGDELKNQWGLAGRIAKGLNGKVKVRPKALLLTSYQRFFICDIFIHGTGGGNYEGIADAILLKFFGAPPAQFLVISGTLLLPLERFDASKEDARKLEEEIREMSRSPQDHLTEGEGGELQHLVAERASLVGVQGSAREKRRAFRRLKEIDRILLEKVKPLREKKEKELAEIKRQLEWNDVACRRDYPFCIYPAEMLSGFYEKAVKSVG